MAKRTVAYKHKLSKHQRKFLIKYRDDVLSGIMDTLKSDSLKLHINNILNRNSYDDSEKILLNLIGNDYKNGLGTTINCNSSSYDIFTVYDEHGNIIETKVENTLNYGK